MDRAVWVGRAVAAEKKREKHKDRKNKKKRGRKLKKISYEKRMHGNGKKE